MPGWLSTYGSGLRVTASIGAWSAVIASLVSWKQQSTLIGLIVGLAVVLGCGVVASLVTANSANRRRFETLQDWIHELEAKVRTLTAAAHQNRANSNLKTAEQDLGRRGPQWIIGQGYVDVSRSLATVETYFLENATVGDLLDAAEFDELRLTGSTVPTRQDLLGLLKTPLSDLRQQATSGGWARAPSTPATATDVKQVRQALNDFRDTSREGLSRLRAHTFDAVAVAGTLVYLLLVVVTVYYRLGEQIASAVALFLVAALVGVISSLNGLSSLSTAEDDFGLTSVRLIANAMLSGLSGVGGVLLVNLASAAGAQLAGAGKASSPLPALNDIFDVVKHPVSLVLAGVFGVTPALFLRGLTALGQKYASGLSTTRPGNTATNSNGTP